MVKTSYSFHKEFGFHYFSYSILLDRFVCEFVRVLCVYIYLNLGACAHVKSFTLELIFVQISRVLFRFWTDKFRRSFAP